MMNYILILLAACLLLLLVYLFMVRGRKGHPGLENLRGWNYAHRGLHDEHRPENSMAAFRAALEHGYGIELDVHLLKDGNLAVIHDFDLKRTTGVEGKIEDLTTEQLSSYHLEGTDQTIPTFREVLELYNGKAPLIVELKSAGNNAARLTETACRMLESYNGVYCVESFDPRCIRWLRKHRPQLIRGQLTENFFVSETSLLPLPLKFIMTHQLLNFLVLPDFVAYRYPDRKTLGNFFVRKIWKVQGVAWTLKDPSQHATALQEGWIPIFEDYLP